MLLISGMHQYLLKALAETYILIPVNGAVLDTSTLLASMLEFLANYITIGFRICLPIFAVMLVLNAVLGILAKISPAAEHVCCGYADEGSGRLVYFVCDHGHASGCREIYL